MKSSHEHAKKHMEIIEKKIEQVEREYKLKAAPLEREYKALLSKMEKCQMELRQKQAHLQAINQEILNHENHKKPEKNFQRLVLFIACVWGVAGIYLASENSMEWVIGHYPYIGMFSFTLACLLLFFAWPVYKKLSQE